MRRKIFGVVYIIISFIVLYIAFFIIAPYLCSMISSCITRSGVLLIYLAVAVAGGFTIPFVLILAGIGLLFFKIEEVGIDEDEDEWI